MRLVKLGAASGAGALLVLSGLAGAAFADAPVKTGWWNAATANGAVLPQPTTGADDLHVAQGPTGPGAIAAVAYDLTGQEVTGATLTLKVVANSAVGTTDVLACPTQDASWKAGGNQPLTAAPKYDCATGLPGIRATDGTSVTFLLGAAQLLAGSGYSLAIVPSSDALPFSVDFAKPDATSLAPETAPAAEPAPTVDTYTPPPATSSGAGSGSSGSVPFLPVAGGGTSGAAPVPVAPEPVPVAAPAPVAPSYAAPAASAPLAPATNRERYQAGTLLALLTGGLVWAWQQPGKERRLIGGLARTAPPERVLVDTRPRGIGRFATARTAPARPLL